MKTAVVFSRNRDASAALDSMLDALRLREWHTAARLSCEPGAAGYVSTSDRFSTIQLTRETANGNWLVVTGVPLDLEGSLDTRLDKCLNLAFESAIPLLEQLDGAFTALLWDNRARKLAIVTDILGMQPLYVYRQDDVFALASDSKALTASRLTHAEMDPAGWGAFLSMKHPIAGQTLAKRIERVPAGSVLIYDADTNNLTSRTYWNWPEPGSDRLEDVPVNDLVEVFLAELKAYLQHNSQPTLCLSGGFDSRLILAGLGELGSIPDTLSLSHADELFDVDGRIASRMARVYGARFTLYGSDRSFYSSPAYVDYLIASEVATPSLYLFIAQLCSTLRPEMQAVWEGVFPGCILFPVHQPPGGFDRYLQRECAPLDSLVWKAAEHVFQPDLADEMRRAFTSGLREEMSRYADDEFGVSQFIVRNRTRHRIAMNPLQVYSNDVIAFTPGISKRFWSLAAAIPYNLRTGHLLYRHIFSKLFPKALSIPAVSGTTPYALNSNFDRDYVLARLGILATQRPKIAIAMRLAGFGHSGDFWEPSRLVDAAVQELDKSVPELSASGIAKLKAARPPYDPMTENAREILFYWSWWRRIHSPER